MPLTPFIGLSIAIHLGIIMIYKIISRFYSRERTTTTVTAPIMRWYGFTIIAIVFIFVFTNAIILVRVSILDKHSIVHFVKNHWSVLRHAAFAKTVVISDRGNSMFIDTSEPTGMSCLADLHTEAKNYQYSVVNYLYTHNQDYSFSARQLLAKQLSIDKYRGTPEQNQLLLVGILGGSKDITDCKVEISL